MSKNGVIHNSSPLSSLIFIHLEKFRGTLAALKTKKDLLQKKSFFTFVKLGSAETGMLNTLNQKSLAEAIHDDKRKNDQQSRRVLNGNLIRLIIRTRLILQQVQSWRHNRPEIGTGKEQMIR